MPKGELVLLRHGETDWAVAGRHTGRSDIALNSAGEAAARARRPELAARAFALVLASPLQRARSTAALALEGSAANIQIDADLAEWDYGAFEGLTTHEIREQLGDASWLVWDRPITPGAANPGEQLADVAARAKRVIERVLPTLLDGQDVLLVAHGHLLRILAAVWLGLEPRAGSFFALSAAGQSVLGFERKQPVIVRWNTPLSE
jgi:broad specificity phosphatase PhoE